MRSSRHVHKNDPDLFLGLRDAANKLNVTQYGHVRGHQDCCGRKLTFVENMNIMADNLASKAVSESELLQPEWSQETGPMLVIRGQPIMNKEGINLCIAAERNEFEIWQMRKLALSRSTCRMQQ